MRKSFLKILVFLVLVFLLSSCAGLNGSANGTHKGASAHTSIFKVPL